MRRIVLLLLLFGVVLTIHQAMADETQGVRFTLDNDSAMSGTNHNGVPAGTTVSGTSTSSPRTDVVLPVLAKWKLVRHHQHRRTLHAAYEYDSVSGWATLRVKVHPRIAENGLESVTDNALGTIFIDERLGTITGRVTLKDGVLRAAYKRPDHSRGMIAARIVCDPRGARYLLTVIGEWPANAPKSYAQDHETLLRLIRIE
jgi:hypothetical protein